MLLENFGYSNSLWTTDLMSLNPQNLFVGKNAVGKSKTIKHISIAAQVIAERKSLEEVDFMSDYAVALRHDQNIRFIYEFGWDGREVSFETLKVYDASIDEFTMFIERTHEKCILDGETINPPANKLIIHSRRDTVKYPFIETLISWAANVEGVFFNELEFDGDFRADARMASDGMNLYSIVKSLSDDAIGNVISMAKTVGYNLTGLQTMELATLRSVVFNEEGVALPMFWSELSKGMFRTLYLLIYMEYLSHNTLPSTLLIDDLCEGLDYDRSTKLGRLVFDFCEKHNIQLIASSNDSLLMDVIDLDYWNILIRVDGKVKAINKTTHSELFENFRFTGLSNFDLISSDYIKRYLKEE